MDTGQSAVEMDMPRGSGYAIGLAIGSGSWVVWAIVFDDMLLGFCFALMTGLLVFGPMFERARAGEVAPEQTRTVRNLLVAGLLIGVTLVAVLLVRLVLLV